MMSFSALKKLATKAAKVSLSPNLISSVATVSFSLMTGTFQTLASLSGLLKYFQNALNSINYHESIRPVQFALYALQINIHKPDQVPFDQQQLLPEVYEYH